MTPIPSEAEERSQRRTGRDVEELSDQSSPGNDHGLATAGCYVRLHRQPPPRDRVIWVGLGRVPDTARDVPGIVVEFVSRRRRDRERDYEQKRHQYLDLGVKEYWIIDLFQRTDCGPP